ncbi:transposase family protein [Kitasatospora sp. NPDC101155]|uniref:transposase family protein n=1 Tax=Kitasatospora sp. NPDC101155 TaxID=3364097 RepID=UPI00382CE7D0
MVAVRPRSRARRRCGICGTRCPRFDAGAGRRRWRHLDAAGLKLYLEADAPRVTCKQHGVVVAAVPWARHDAGHTRDFDRQVAWMATECSKSATVKFHPAVGHSLSTPRGCDLAGAAAESRVA